jgi:GNAT superfamily N-acetyltransferase
VSFECTPGTFIPVPDLRVRWLDQESDVELVRGMWETKGIPVTPADWDDWHRQGYHYCGIVEDGRLAAVAAVWAYSPTAWQLAAVQTREGYRSRGYAKAVYSFATAHILDNGRTATSSTRADNTAMRSVLARLGFRPIGGDGSV